MTTLAADLSLTASHLSQDLDPGFYTIGSENIRVLADQAFERSSRGNGQLTALGPYVLRGIGGSIISAHSAGATIDQYYPDAPGGEAGSGLLQTATVTLTDDQIKALPTSPPTIVAAQGAGKVILPIGGILVATIQANYVASSEPTPALGWGTASHSLASDYIGQGFLTTGTGTFFTPISVPHTVADFTFASFRGTNHVGLTLIEDLPLELFDDDQDGGPDYTGGNAANTLKVTVYYVVVDL